MMTQSARGGLLILGGVAMAIGVLVLLNAGEPGAADVDVEGRPVVGSGGTEVFLFEDYQCPHCRDYELGAAKEHLMKTWVEPGEIQIVFKFVAFIGDDSWSAARASHCVHALAPGSWPEWNRLTFAAQGEPDAGWASADAVSARTAEWGEVEMTAYEACLEDEATLDALIRDNGADMTDAGIRGTPGLLVGTATPDPSDVRAVDAAIETALGRDGDPGDGSNAGRALAGMD